MKKILTVLVAGLLLLNVYSVFGSPISLCDYTPAETRYSALSVGLNYRYFDDQYKTPELSHDANSGNLNLRYDNLLSLPSYGYNLSLRSLVTYNDGALAKADLSYSITGLGRYNMYLTGGDHFAFGGARVEAADDFENIGVSITTGSGYGRFRDVTPLAKTMKINEMLLEGESITEALSDDILQEIAQKIDRKEEYKDMKTLVGEIEGLIEATNLVEGEELGAIELLRIREIIEEIGDRKLCGWEVKGGIGYELIDPQDQKPDFLTNAAFNYAQPFNPYSQLRINLDFTSSFNIAENYSLNGLFEYAYRISETLDTEITYSYRQRTHEGDRFDSHSLDMSIIFQPQENLNLSVNLSSAWESDYEEWTKGVSIGVNYNLS